METLIKRHGSKLVQGGMGATIVGLLIDAWIQHGSSFELQTKNDQLKISGEKYWAQIRANEEELKIKEQEINDLRKELAYLEGWWHIPQQERTK